MRGGLRINGSLDGESTFVSEPVKGELDQFVDRFAAMVAGDFLVQVPPHTFDRIGFGGIRGQEVNHNAMAPPGQELLHLGTVMELGVVADHMNAAVAPQAAPQVVQMTHKQIGVALGARRGHQQLACPPMQRTGQIAFDVVARRDHLGLLASTHPHRADLRVGVDVHFVLEDRRFVVGKRGQQMTNCPQFAGDNRGLSVPTRDVADARRTAPGAANGGPSRH